MRLQTTLLFLSLFSLLSLNTTAQDQETDREKDDLKGPVMVLTQSSYKAKKEGDRVIKGSRYLQPWESDKQYVYDKEGRKIESYDLGLTGVKNKYTNKYAGDKLIEAASYRGEDQLEHTFVYTYNDEGNSMTYQRIDANGEKGFKRYSIYDSEDKLLELGSFESNGDLYSRNIREYDDNGNCISNDRYSGPLEELVSTTTFTYDNKNQLTKKVTLNPDGSIKEQVFYRYNEEGKLQDEATFDGNKNLKGGDSYKYDTKGNVTGHIDVKPIKENSVRLDKTYDPNGNVTSSKTRLLSGQKIGKDHRYTYTYDAYGNWITRITFEDEAPTRFIERDIKYYE